MRVIILRKDRTAQFKTANPKRPDYELEKSLYILSPDRIKNWTNKHGVHEGAQIIFFEDNPNGLTSKAKAEDKSLTYLDDIVKINFIQQATDTMGKWNLPSVNLKWLFERPERIPMVIMFGWVAWILFGDMIWGSLFA